MSGKKSKIIRKKESIKKEIRSALFAEMNGKIIPGCDPHPVLKVAAGKTDILINSMVKDDPDNEKMYYEAGLEVGQEILDKLGIKH